MRGADTKSPRASGNTIYHRSSTARLQNDELWRGPLPSNVASLRMSNDENVAADAPVRTIGSNQAGTGANTKKRVRAARKVGKIRTIRFAANEIISNENDCPACIRSRVGYARQKPEITKKSSTPCQLGAPDEWRVRRAEHYSVWMQIWSMMTPRMMIARSPSKCVNLGVPARLPACRAASVGEVMRRL